MIEVDPAVLQEFPVIAIILLILGLAFGSLWLVVKELRKWSGEQEAQRLGEEKRRDAERSLERQLQRDWERETLTNLSNSWQTFIVKLEAQRELDAQADRGEMTRLAEAVNQMVATVREQTGSVREMTVMVGGMMTQLREHIAADDARFDVLLTDPQRAKVEMEIVNRKARR